MLILLMPVIAISAILLMFALGDLANDFVIVLGATMVLTLFVAPLVRRWDARNYKPKDRHDKFDGDDAAIDVIHNEIMADDPTSPSIESDPDRWLVERKRAIAIYYAKPAPFRYKAFSNMRAMFIAFVVLAVPTGIILTLAKVLTPSENSQQSSVNEMTFAQYRIESDGEKGRELLKADLKEQGERLGFTNTHPIPMLRSLAKPCFVQKLNEAGMPYAGSDHDYYNVRHTKIQDEIRSLCMQKIESPMYDAALKKAKSRWDITVRIERFFS